MVRNKQALTENNALRNTAANNASNDNERLRLQNEALSRELANANNLQNEIRSLQNRLNSQRYDQRGYNTGYNKVPATVYPPVSPVYNQQQPIIIRDTVYLTDTLVMRDKLAVRDTINIRDTITVMSKDTITNTVSTTPKTIYVPIEKTIIVKEQIDYTQLPVEVVLFDVGKSNIKATYYSPLNYFSGLLKKDSSLAAIITGHTDKTGSPAINEALSKRRANAVKEYMVAQGATTQQLKIEAVSATDPAVVGNTKSALSQNRRVTIKLVTGTK
ncbi:hypothetical protein BH10BAC3_BH10BAC3_04590 [soil metagenome]